MPRPNTDTITQSINSLRIESSPDAVTPARVANLLQAIVDLINALSMVPDTEVTDIMQLINNAVSTAQAAASAAAAAQTAANNKLISRFKADAAADSVTITIKQSGHTAKSFALPIADASQAGIVLPSVLQSITNAAAIATNGKLNTISLTYGSGITLTFKAADNSTLATKTIPLVTTTHHGLMAAVDKEKLDALPSSGVVALDAAGRVPASNAPQVMLRNITGGAPDDLHNGDFYFDQADSHIYYIPNVNGEPVPMGPPSKNVVYCHTDTNILYRWNGSAFVPVLNDPNYAMQSVEVRRNNTTQKIYNVPNGVLADMILTTDVVNINLLPAANGASVHRLLFKPTNIGNASQINWPNNANWAGGGAPPSLATIEGCDGCLVTIYDGLFAEFKYYGI